MIWSKKKKKREEEGKRGRRSLGSMLKVGSSKI